MNESLSYLSFFFFFHFHLLQFSLVCPFPKDTCVFVCKETGYHIIHGTARSIFSLLSVVLKKRKITCSHNLPSIGIYLGFVDIVLLLWLFLKHFKI